MKSFCLPPKDVERFKLALKSKEIKIADLINMDTATRTELLRKYAGDSAPEVNLLFEQKLVLKNKMQGLKNWASSIGEIGRYSPKKKAQMEQMIDEYKQKQFERTFSPKEEETFLNDLADAKMGTHITREEAQAVFELSKKSESLKENYSEDTGWKDDRSKSEFGAARVLEEKYLDNLKNEELPISEMIKRRYLEARNTFANHKVKAVGDLLKDTIKEISDVSISLVASVDNSFMGRQGIHTLMTHPTIWGKMAGKSFVDIYNVLRQKHGGEMVKDAMWADVYSRSNYMNGNYDLAKLIPANEEQFPATHPAILPVVGRVFNASEKAFTNSAIRSRIDLFDLYHDIAKKNGVDIKDRIQIQEMGSMINSLTAKGDLGKFGDGGVVRLVMWAPKMLKANWDVLTAHTGGAGLQTPFARQQARINLLKVVASTAVIAATANALRPGSVELDPRSSDFMKIKVNNTRFDTTGGAASLVTLLSRLITMSSKSTRTGKVTPLNSGKFGSKTGFDVGIDFLVNKTTPFTRAGIDYVRGRKFNGKKPTVLNTAYGLTTPISIQNFVKNFYGDDPNGDAAAVVGSMVDLIGINANTYDSNKKWGK